MGFRHSAWFTLEFSVSAVAQLALSAWMIQQLGLHAFGDWAYVQATLNVCAMASIGVIPGLSVRVLAATDRDSCAAWIGAATWLAVPLALCLLLTVVGISRLLPGAGPWSAPAPVWTLPLLAVSIACGETINIVSAALRARGRYRDCALHGMAFRCFGATALGTLCLSEPALTTLLLTHAAVCALQLAALIAVWQRRAPIQCGPRANTSSSVRQLLPSARWQWIKASGGLLFAAGDRLLIGQLMGPAVLAVYAVCLQLADPLHRLTSMVLQPLLLWSARQQHLGRRLRDRWPTFLAIELAVLGMAALAFMLAPLLLPWWTGSHHPDNAEWMRWAIAGSTLNALHVPVHFLLSGRGANRMMGLASVGGAVLTLLAMSLSIESGLATVLACRCLYGLALFASWPVLFRLDRQTD